jgi:hypothetical protein
MTLVSALLAVYREIPQCRIDVTDKEADLARMADHC